MSITNFLDVAVDWSTLNASYVRNWDGNEVHVSPVLYVETEFDGDDCTGNITYGNIYVSYEEINFTSPRLPYCEDEYYYAWLNFTAYPSVKTEVNDVRGLFKYAATVAAETGISQLLEALESTTSAVMVPYSQGEGFTLKNEGDDVPSFSDCSDLQREWDAGRFTTISIGDVFIDQDDDVTFDWAFYLNYTATQSCEEALAFAAEFGDADQFSNITNNLNCVGECFDFDQGRRRAYLEPTTSVGFALDKAAIMELFTVDSSSSSESDKSDSSRSAVGIMGTLAVVAVSLTML